MQNNSVEQFEIDFKKSWPRSIRVSLAAIATVVLVWAAIALFSGPVGRPDVEAAIPLIVVILAALTIRRTIFNSDVRWIVQSDGIRIERSWIYGRRHVEFIRAAEIIEIMLFEDQVEEGYSAAILLRLAGLNIESPSVGDAQRAHELQAEIARRLSRTAIKV